MRSSFSTSGFTNLLKYCSLRPLKGLKNLAKKPFTIKCKEIKIGEILRFEKGL